MRTPPGLDAQASNRAGTPQQRTVLQALSHAQGFISAQSLHSTIRSTGERIGLTTVYRALHAFVSSGQAHTIRDADGTQLFSIAPADGVGYHLICRECRRHVPISVTFVEEWAAHTAGIHAFTDAEVVIEIAGRCHPCTTAVGENGFRGQTARAREHRLEGDVPGIDSDARHCADQLSAGPS